ncbi:hypothetical protein RhiJN_26473 [Ceratobasidium sp. AG-Ba]|nr:hypothetical protein RhiJN_26473 [Ceratobasidium sp. AG-Ba]
MSVTLGGRRLRRFDINRLLDRGAGLVLPLDAAAPLAAASTLPLPGLGDIKTVIEGIASLLQTSPFERSRCSALAFKVRSLSSMVDDMEELELDYIEDVTNELLAIKQDFSIALAPRSSSLRRADEMIEALELLNMRTDTIIKMIEAKLKLETAISNKYKAYGEIKTHEVSEQVLVPFERRSCPCGDIIEYQDTNSRGGVIESRFTGHVGNIPVLYTRYSAVRASDAEKVFAGIPHWPQKLPHDFRPDKMERARIDWHERYMHPNLARIFGVTPGIRLKGVVLTTGRLEWDEFWRCVASPRAATQCIKDLMAIPKTITLESRDPLSLPIRLYPETARVDLDGHITFTLTDIQEARCTLTLPGSWMLGSEASWLSSAVAVCGAAISQDRYKLLSNFLTELAPITSGITELRVLKLAETTKAPPRSLGHAQYKAASTPSFTIWPGDVGTWTHVSKYDTLYSVNQHAQWVVHPHGPNLEYMSRQNKWETKSMSICHGFAAIVPPRSNDLYQQWDWERRAKFWRSYVSGSSNQDIQDLCTCTTVGYLISVEEYGVGANNRFVYYHRRPFARSNPRDFWGYMSLSSDPENRNSDLERNGWVLKHSILVDDWGYRYRRLLRDSMAAVPGSFTSIEQDEGLDWLFDDNE